jgi:hypothetical protein
VRATRARSSARVFVGAVKACTSDPGLLVGLFVVGFAAGALTIRILL